MALKLEGVFPPVPTPFDSDGKILHDKFKSNLEQWNAAGLRGFAVLGSNGEFVIDGNLTSVEYGDRLSAIHVPTLITVGDNDECDPAISRDMQRLIKGSRLVILPQSGHMTFVDQPGMFLRAVDEFLNEGA